MISLGRITTVACALLATSAVAAAAAATGAGAREGVKLPPFERVTLDNGAQLVLMPKRDTPMIAMTVLARGGSLADAPGREGTASLLADLAQKGAGSRDAALFAEAIEGAGGSLSVATGAESLAISASFLARDTGLMIELVSDALLRPRLDPAEFEKARALAIQSIAAAKDADPYPLLGEYGDAWLFRGHPFGRPVDGSEESLAAVTLDDVRRHYGEQVRGDRLIIAVVGDFDPKDVTRRLGATFGALPKATSAAPVVQAAPRVAGRRVLLVDKPGDHPDVFLARQRRRLPHRSRAHGAVGGQHGVRRTLHLDAQHRAAHQERAYLRRTLGLRSARATGGVQHHLVHGDRDDRAGDRPRARDARPPARRRPRRRNARNRREPTCTGSFRPRSRPTASSPDG